MCIYNVIVLGLVGLPASLLLQTDVNASFGVVSVLFIAGTTSTQCVIFVPKVRKTIDLNINIKSTCYIYANLLGLH